MPRSLRIQYPGATYHVMARGNRREAIVRDGRESQACLETFQVLLGSGEKWTITDCPVSAEPVIG